MVSVVQWAIFASSPIFMEPPDCVLDLVVASRCLLDHKSSQEATMPHASHAETHRHEHGESCAHNHSERVSSHEHSHNHADACCSAAPVALAKLSGPETIGANVRTAIRIMQMDCPTEEALIRKKLGRMPYVRSLDFNLMQRVLTVVHAPEALGSILASLRSLDFEPQLTDATTPLA